MASAKLIPVVHRLRRSVEAAEDRHTTDRQLLRRYAANGDEGAFTTLVRRHGPRVLGACRQVLSDAADVDDAFQATFLVLLQKAGSVRWRDDLGGWLYAVAHRVAVRARTKSQSRRRHEGRASASPRESPPPDLSWRDACALLHAELDRLPDKFRLPLLLCYLEGRSRDEAAAQLGLTTAAVKSRLERGRNALRAGLRRCGVTLTAGLLMAVANSPAGAVPARLVQATLSAAAGPAPASVAALVQGVTAIMILGKFKCVAGLLLVVGLLGTLFVLNPLAPAVADPPQR